MSCQSNGWGLCLLCWCTVKRKKTLWDPFTLCVIFSGSQRLFSDAVSWFTVLVYPVSLSPPQLQCVTDFLHSIECFWTNSPELVSCCASYMHGGREQYIHTYTAGLTVGARNQVFPVKTKWVSRPKLRAQHVFWLHCVQANWDYSQQRGWYLCLFCGGFLPVWLLNIFAKWWS